MKRWAIVTGEYPPDPGGVSDYTRLVACGLAAAGDSVRVFAPPHGGGSEPNDPGVEVHRLPGRFGPRSLLALERLLARAPGPDCILIQYVPHAFSYKAMNLPFALWIALQARRIAPVWVMFHEVAVPFIGRSAKHLLLGSATRVMARLIAGAASRIFVSISTWGELLSRICPRAVPSEWLPVPCNVPIEADPAAVAAVRSRFAPNGEPLVGHFGTFGGPIADLLAPAIAELLQLAPTTSVLLIGRGSVRFRERLVAANPGDAKRVHSAGELAGHEVSVHLRACDLMLQPFPDGISSRRTSAMAGLANAVPLVTNLGALSEPIWANGAVAAAPSPDPAELSKLAAKAIAEPAARAELGRRGAALYHDRFSPEHTTFRLRGETRG